MKNKYLIDQKEWDIIKNVSEQHNILPETLILCTFIEIVQTWNDWTENDIEIACISDKHPDGRTVFSLPPATYSCMEACKHIEKQLQSEPGGAELSVLEDNRPHIAFEYQRISTLHSASSYPYEIKCEAAALNNGLEITWTITGGALQKIAVTDMVNAHGQILRWIEKGNLNEPLPDLLPDAQRKTRNRANHTFAGIPEKLLHRDFFAHARKMPGNTALLWNNEGKSHTITYGELSEKARCLAALLIEKGVKPGEPVAVTLPKGPGQILAVLAILAAGGAYLPVSADHPEERQAIIRNIAGVKHIISDKQAPKENKDTAGLNFISLHDIEGVQAIDQPVENHPDATAYIIFTSGSTGEPKGVEIAHKAAYNTIYAINLTYGVNAQDRVLALSALDFDLSVYDIFGLLSAGGSIVLISENERKEAPVWLKLVQQHKVTIWNSVPALFDMLLVASSEQDDMSSLKTILLSGDWVGLDLPVRIKKHSPGCRFIALGGATEASIWSNHFEVHTVLPEWKSIPYGTPLANQEFRVVNKWGKDCPDMIAGELWIGGKGVAKGYLKRPGLTANSFVRYHNRIWYKTGDMGRYGPDGNIEFLGRKDQQVKVRGYRIELGEIEATLKKYKGIAQAVATVISDGPAQHLVAGVVGNIPPKEYHKQQNTVENRMKPREYTIHNLQRKIIIHFLDKLLELQKLEQADGEWDPVKNPDIAPEQAPVLHMWLKWLETQGFISRNKKGYKTGPAFNELSQISPYSKDNLPGELKGLDKYNLVKVQESLHGAINNYKAILDGSLPVAALLNIDGLSPEYLSSIDTGTIKGIEKLADKINKLAADRVKTVEIAILGGRTGVLSEILLKSVTPDNIHFTVMDSAPSMVEAASQRLKTSLHRVTCVKVPDFDVPDPYRYHFDMVVGMNVFHRYRQISQGLSTAFLMLKTGGALFILEHFELAPVALVTSAVLDRAFADYDSERRRKANPMISGEEWAENLAGAGFVHIKHMPVPGTITNIIEAECPACREQPDPVQILEFASTLLPPHMLPEKIKILPFLPLSPNGKVDKKTFSSGFIFQAKTTETELPRKGTEQEIAAIWKDLLRLEQVGRNQVFFQVGGDSLLATRFLSIIKQQYEVKISLREIFEAPLNKIALEIEKKCKEQKEEMELMEEGEI